MVDETAKRWTGVAARLGERLPGEWAVAGRGVKALLVRQPADWVLVWVGLSRVRGSDRPHLMGGATPLVQGPFHPALRVGLSSDTRRHGPRQFDLTDPEHEDQIEQFVVGDVLPLVEPWSVERFAADAEQQFALPLGERLPPRRWFEVPGWRVLLESGSPVEPAREAAEWARSVQATAIADWHEPLVAAWETGGRAAALGYLREQRAAALAELKVPNPEP
ncbi:hypothetical protein [uncultured Friedmanniella sp.]|uniref:hypothetical protein n=1 Tax=uncultured Friedmanniella sp. TaxID=335381 RepID=UPI0035CAD896